MAVIKEKKNTEIKTVAPKALREPSGLSKTILLQPRITEKASFLAERNVYAFTVARDATKQSIARAIQKLYKFKPIKVRIVQIPSKKVFVRGKVGVKSGGKKAYVYLSASDKIELV
ncbi:50S ribosomal protein L23 [Candidatus Parcubacteria bacterium]|nr:50S ribosomal protein L23 [Candidatus Parcubacteria bacterium]